MWSDRSGPALQYLSSASRRIEFPPWSPTEYKTRSHHEGHLAFFSGLDNWVLIRVGKHQSGEHHHRVGHESERKTKAKSAMAMTGLRFRKSLIPRS